jgi:hypothetical protein
MLRCPDSRPHPSRSQRGRDGEGHPVVSLSTQVRDSIRLMAEMDSAILEWPVE